MKAVSLLMPSPSIALAARRTHILASLPQYSFGIVTGNLWRPCVLPRERVRRARRPRRHLAWSGVAGIRTRSETTGVADHSQDHNIRA